MNGVWKQSELVASMPTRVGLLRDVCRALSDEGINILSIEAYDAGDTGEFYLITSDDELAAEKLTQMGADIGSKEVVCAEIRNSPGALLMLASAVANAGVNIWQMRATGAPGNETGLIVFRVEDPDALVEALGGAQ